MRSHTTAVGAQGDIFKEFEFDMQASGMSDKDIPKRQTFGWVFYNSKDLKNIEVSGLKRNFCRCTTCCEIEAEVQAAIKSHSRDDLRVAKAKCANHILEEKSDKFHYYCQRCVSRRARARAHPYDARSRTSCPCSSPSV